MQPFLKYLYIILGSISLALGFLGIFLPLLPTTPFLLLTAFLYAKGSKKFHTWLLNNKWFGQYIKDYQSHKGIPQRIKFKALFLLWTTMIISGIFVLHHWGLRILLLVIAIGVTIHLIRIPNKETQKGSQNK